jgi:hypothetical protein
MSSEFNVSKNNSKTVQCHNMINIVSINHIDIDSNNYGSFTLNYTDGPSNISIRFKGNGGLIFCYNDIETEELTKGTWDLQNLLQLPVFLTAICSNTYIENTWEFCFHNYLSSVTFFTNTTWTGMNSVRVFSSFGMPLYFRGPVTSMQEHNKKIIVSALTIQEANTAKHKLEDFDKYKFTEYERAKIEVFMYPKSTKFVFKTTGDIKTIMHAICGSKNFFIDENGFMCCKTWYDISLMNTCMEINLPLEQVPVAPVSRVTSIPTIEQMIEETKAHEVSLD